MKKFKGTPGPWSIGYYGDGDGIFIAGTYGGPDPTYICSVRPDLRSSQSESNVHLIAAAPSLLKELQKLREYVINLCGVDDEDCDSEHPLMSSQAAISKALGEE